MAFTKNKIWVKNNYLFLRLKTGELLSDHKSDVEITPTTSAENEFLITSNKIGTYTIKVIDMIDVNHIQFTNSTFSDFYTENSGFNPDAGGSASIPLSDKGAPNGVATLDSGGQVPIIQIPAAIKGGIKVVGFWDSNTNTPDLSLLSLNQGESYIISVAGSTDLNGETNWNLKDLAIWDDNLTGNWFKLDNTDDVLSVAGKTGIVTLDIGDVSGLQSLLDLKLETVSSDGTISGNGTILNPLKVVSKFDSFNEDNTAVVTFSTTGVTHSSLYVLGLDDSKDYYAMCFWVWSHDAIGTDAFFEFHNAGVNVLNERLVIEPKDAGGSGTGGTDQRIPGTCRKKVNSTSGEIFLDFVFGTTSATHETTVHECNIFLIEKTN